TNLVASHFAIHQSNTGNNTNIKRQSNNVLLMARCASRANDETSIPSASEKNSVLASTSASRQSSNPVTPPIKSPSPMTGNAATSPYAPRSEQATSLPSTTSNPRRSVRNSSPSVPSRFSSLSVSEARKTPEPAATANAIQLRYRNTSCPSCKPNPPR